MIALDYPCFRKEQGSHSFTDKEYHDDLGLYYFEARYYNPETAHFTSIDPMQHRDVEKLLMDPQSLNGYAYARNNPMVFVDPSGEAFYDPRDWDWKSMGQSALQSLDVMPVTGDVSDIYAMITGNSLFSQEELTEEEIAIAAMAGFFPVVTSGSVRMLDEVEEVVQSVGTKVDNVISSSTPKITFGHGARHLQESGLAQDVVEDAIISDVNKTFQNSSSVGEYWGKVNVGEQVIEYRAKPLDTGEVNIGTYYVKD